MSAATLASPAHRATLAEGPKPHWEIVEPGVHLGYYKGSRTSNWYVRRFVGEGRYRQARLGPCREGGAPASGGLSHEQAVAAARAWTPEADASPGVARPAARGAGRLRPSRLDSIFARWAAQRPDIDAELLSLFLKIEHAHVLHEQRVAALSRSLGVHAGDLHVLLALRRNGVGIAMRPTDLFRELLITSGAITKRLDRLKASKLIERTALESDRRSGLVRLTAKGAALADRALTRMSGSLTAIVSASGVSRAELRTLDATVRALIERM